MASKKGVGSSKNGRESEAKRLGVKRGDGQYVSAARSSIPATTSASAATIPSLRRSTARSNSSATTRNANRSASTQKKHKANSINTHILPKYAKIRVSAFSDTLFDTNR
jgi:hypothetical protein